MIKRFKISFLLPVLMLAVATLPSCVRYDDPLPYFENNADTVAPLKRKVLIIGIDGAVGAEYKTIQPTVLEGLKPHSKYTYDGFSDESSTDAASWKTLMSGVSYAKHKISDSSLVYSQPLDEDEHGVIKSYPSFLNYILTSSKSDTRTTVISSWSTMMNKIATEAENKILGVDDAAVKDSAVAKLPTSNSDIVIVHFNGVAKAGKTSGFSATAQGYKDAVTTVDGYIGNIMTALKSRPEYGKKEEWLVIILGTHGGTGTTYGGSSAQEVNNVAFYYNEKFKTVEFLKGGFTSVQMKDNKTYARIPDDGGLYNPDTLQQTVSVKLKCNAGANWPHFFSKMQNSNLNTPGWSFYTNSTGIWCFWLNNSSGTIKKIEPSIAQGNPNVLNGAWHTLTFKFMDTVVAGNKKRYLVRYVDGVRLVVPGVEPADITTMGAIITTSPLTMGFGANPNYNAIPVNFADCMIFNTALSDAEVASLATMPDLKQHPKYNNLIGYWPCNEGYGTAFKNIAPGAVKKDFIINGTYSWVPLADLPKTALPVISEPARKTLQLKSVDVASTLMYWLKIPVNTSWSLDGSTWLNQYEMEFVKL